jgi:diketogulonate reductase-like aldo/keto reductase
MDQKITLNNGVQMPAMGLGVWKAEDGKEVEQAVLWALEAGYRLIDTAKIYNNEDGVGRAIKQSGIPREEIFVTTKLWNEDQGYDTGLKAIDGSLQRLGLDYVDLYLIHWPITVKPAADIDLSLPTKRPETWKAMEEIYKAGKAKAIGVSNYAIKHLEEMKSYASVPPAVNQVEFHPFLVQEQLLNYCKANNIIVEAYCPLIHGTKLNDDRITAVAKKYNKSNAQILIRWSIQHGCVPIPKSTRQDRIKENIVVFDFELSAEDMAALDQLNENYRNTYDPDTMP